MKPPRQQSKRTVKAMAKDSDRDHPRYLIVHNYHDYANVTQEEAEAVPKKRRRGGVTKPFPTKLMETLEKIEDDGYGHIISWHMDAAFLSTSKYCLPSISYPSKLSYAPVGILLGRYVAFSLLPLLYDCRSCLICLCLVLSISDTLDKLS